MATRISTIQFTGQDPRRSALRIRQNHASPITLPEFSTNPVRNVPAVYARDQVTQNNPPAVVIRVELSGGNPNSQCRVAAAGGGILGIVPAQPVQFNNQGNATVDFTLNQTKFAANSPVNRQQITWEWYQQQGNNETKFAQTSHEIGTVLDLPRAPWTQNGSASDPWITALVSAIGWADGATTIADAATGITRGTNQTSAGYSPQTHFGHLDQFNLTRYLQLLADGWFFNMNCTDCANVVTTLTNLLGGNYWEGRVDAFTTNPILPITSIAKANWGYHEFCWNQFDPGGSIWDAALRIPAGNDFHLPTNAPYQNYINLLASGPRPNLIAFSNKRRSVI